MTNQNFDRSTGGGKGGGQGTGSPEKSYERDRDGSLFLLGSVNESDVIKGINGLVARLQRQDIAMVSEKLGVLVSPTVAEHSPRVVAKALTALMFYSSIDPENVKGLSDIKSNPSQFLDPALCGSLKARGEIKDYLDGILPAINLMKLDDLESSKLTKLAANLGECVLSFPGHRGQLVEIFKKHPAVDGDVVVSLMQKMSMSDFDGALTCAEDLAAFLPDMSKRFAEQIWDEGCTRSRERVRTDDIAGGMNLYERLCKLKGVSLGDNLVAVALDRSLRGTGEVAVNAISSLHYQITNSSEARSLFVAFGGVEDLIDAATGEMAGVGNPTIRESAKQILLGGFAPELIAHFEDLLSRVPAPDVTVLASDANDLMDTLLMNRRLASGNSAFDGCVAHIDIALAGIVEGQARRALDEAVASNSAPVLDDARTLLVNLSLMAESTPYDRAVATLMRSADTSVRGLAIAELKRIDENEGSIVRLGLSLAEVVNHAKKDVEPDKGFRKACSTLLARVNEQSETQQTNEEGPDRSKSRSIDDSLVRPLESRGGKFFRGVAEFIGGKPGKFCLSATGVYIGLEKIPGLGNQIHNWLMERNLIDLGPETLSWAGPATSVAVCVTGAYVAWKAVSWMTSLALGKNKP